MDKAGSLPRGLIGKCNQECGQTIQYLDIEARTLAAEAGQLKEFLGYTLRSITSDEEDIGAQIEKNSRPWQEQEQAPQQPAA